MINTIARLQCAVQPELLFLLVKLHTTPTSLMSIHHMAAILNSSSKVSIRNICLSGCRKPGTMFTILASFSMLITWTITIHLILLDSQVQ